MLVEDEPSVAKLFQFNLEKADFNVTIATNGSEGFKLAKEDSFDLILSDIMMPISDGYQFRKQILDDSNLKNIPFVFLTAKGSEEDILTGYDLGIDEYIIKTSPPKIVIAKLKAILSSKNKREEEAVDELNKAVNNLGSRVVPKSAPLISNYKIDHWHKPYKDIPGGDFIDYIQIDNDTTVVIIGDVMGKKWNAWYFALAYAGYIRSSIRAAVETASPVFPSNILERVNKTVFHDERISEIFTTISILTINSKINKVFYSGAGDLPLLLKQSDSMIREIHSGGLLLGFSETSDYLDVELELKKNDIIYLITDGIIESENPDGEFYGIERFKQLLGTYSDSGNCLDYIKSEINSFTSSNFSDDISLVSIKYI